MQGHREIFNTEDYKLRARSSILSPVTWYSSLTSTALLRELRQQTTVDTAARDEQIKRINDLQDFIVQQTAHLTGFDEALVRR